MTPTATVPTARDLGAIIRRIRIEADMTQEELARHLGMIDRSGVAQWETGRSMPEDDKLVRIAELAKVKPASLKAVKEAIQLGRRGIDLRQIQGEILSDEEKEVLYMLRRGEYARLVAKIAPKITNKSD